MVNRHHQVPNAIGNGRKPDTRQITAGYTDIDICARGLVSEECGGDKVDYGGVRDEEV